MTLTLEITGPYPPGGYHDPLTDETHYNDTVMTPYGELGSFKADPHGGKLTILRADRVVLLRRGFPDQWSTPTLGVSKNTSAFGFDVLKFDGVNGKVLYRLHEDTLRWGDEKAAGTLSSSLDKWQLAVQVGGSWIPLADIPSNKRTVVETKQAKLVQSEDKV